MFQEELTADLRHLAAELDDLGENETSHAEMEAPVGVVDQVVAEHQRDADNQQRKRHEE